MSESGVSPQESSGQIQGDNSLLQRFIWRLVRSRNYSEVHLIPSDIILEIESAVRSLSSLSVFLAYSRN